MWAKVRAAVVGYFTRTPVLAPGLLAEFMVTVEARDDRPFLRSYTFNHSHLTDSQLVQAMADAFIVMAVTKGADKASVLAYVESRWPPTTSSPS